MKRNFLLLLSLNKENALMGKAVLDKIKLSIDATAAPAYFHSAGIGVLMWTDLSAREVWQKMWPENLSPTQKESFRDAMLLQLGTDHATHPESKVGAWLNSHPTGEPR